MIEKYIDIDIGINLTVKQFCGEVETIISNAVKAGVGHIILTRTSVEN